MMQTVMIVDDDQDEIELLRRVLKKAGRVKNITTAQEGEAALELLRTRKVAPSLILLDLKMPGMGGIETVRQLRADACLKDIPVVIVTNSSLESDKQAAYDAGADAFLQKAFNMDQFGKDIKLLIDRWITA